MESPLEDPKTLVLVQQAGIVVTSIATLAIAGIKIFQSIKSNSTSTTEK